MNQKAPKQLSAEQLHAWLQKKPLEPFLVDVREENELAIAAFPEAVLHLPLSQASLWRTTLFEMLPKNKPVVVICHAGIRSWNFAQWLIEQSWGYEVWNLEGGIDAWSLQIDPTLPRY